MLTKTEKKAMWILPLRNLFLLTTALVLMVLYGPDILNKDLELTYTWAYASGSLRIPPIAVAILLAIFLTGLLFIADLLFWFLGIGLEGIGKFSGRSGKAMKNLAAPVSPDSH